MRELRGDPEIGDRDCRERHNPTINFGAESLKELIAWDNVRLEPVLTADIPTSKFISFSSNFFAFNEATFFPDELIKYLDKPMEVPTWPSNTQAVERAVADLDRAGKLAVGEEKRDGRLLAFAEARRILPKKDTKKDFSSMIAADFNSKFKQ